MKKLFAFLRVLAIFVAGAFAYHFTLEKVIFPVKKPDLLLEAPLQPGYLVRGIAAPDLPWIFDMNPDIRESKSCLADRHTRFAVVGVVEGLVLLVSQDDPKKRDPYLTRERYCGEGVHHTIPVDVYLERIRAHTAQRIQIEAGRVLNKRARLDREAEEAARVESIRRVINEFKD